MRRWTSLVICFQAGACDPAVWMKSAAKLVRVSEELAEEHKRRNALATLCKLREALRLLYFGALSLRGRLFCYPPGGQRGANTPGL
jgi:hypothetical protein